MPATAARSHAKTSTAQPAVKRTLRAAWRELPSGVHVHICGDGDHYAAHEFLRRTAQRPTDDEFTARLERPGYAPEQRLTLMEAGRIVGHVLCTPRVISLGQVARIPTVELSELCVAGDRRQRGYGSALTDAAIEHARQWGVQVGTLRTRAAGFYQRLGWSLGSKHSWSTACPRDVLSLLSASTSAASLEVRVWRQVEQDALQRLHLDALQRQPGLVQRDEEMWRWLVSCNVFDRIYVAVDHSPGVAPDAPDSIVAFAIVRGGRIVESASSPGRDDAISELLRRVCYDAIESGDMEVRCDGPIDSPLHSLLKDSGGRYFHVEADRDLVNMACIPSVAGFLEHLRGELDLRASAGGLSRPSELGLAVAMPNGRTEKTRIALAKKSTQIATGKVGRSYLTGDWSVIQQWLLGRCSVEELIADGRLEASTQTAIELAKVLLPRLHTCRSVLDDLSAAR